MVSLQDLLLRFGFLENDTSKSNNHHDKDPAIVNSLAQTKIVSVGCPTDRNSMPGVVVVIHSDSNHTTTSLLVQIIQAACDKIFGSVENRNTSSSPEKLALNIDLPPSIKMNENLALDSSLNSPSPRESTSPGPAWGLFDPDTRIFRGLVESPTTPHSRKNVPATLTRNFGNPDFFAPLPQYPDPASSQKNNFLNKG